MPNSAPKRLPLLQHDLTDMRLLVAVAETGSLTLGAQRCHMAASSASLRIKGLEEVLGVTLLHRQSRGVRVTPAGQLVLEHARESLMRVNQLRADLLPFTDGYGSPTSLMANSNAIASFLPLDLPAFLVRHAQVRLTVEEHTSAQIVMAVAAGRADLGVVAWEGDHPDLRFAPYRTDEIVLVAPRGHPLARRARVRFAECVHQAFVALPSGSAIHTFLVAQAEELGVSLDCRVQVWGFAAVCSFVATGVGVAVVPRSTIRGDSSELAIIGLQEPWARRTLRLCIHAERPPSAMTSALFEHLQHSAEEARRTTG
jgi:DNA-binding transcriptional LysR family regulator